MTFNEVKENLSQKYPELEIYQIDPSIFCFEERVKQKCYHCRNYGQKWTCPPRIPNVDYKKMFGEYEYAAVIICEVSVNDLDFEEKRAKSTNLIHKALLYLEKVLYD